MNEDGSTGRPANIGLGHELGHAGDIANGTNNTEQIIVNGNTRQYMKKGEYNIRQKVDNPIRKEQGAKLRAKPKITD